MSSASITLIIPKNRYNYHSYALFLSKLQLEFDFRVVGFDDDSHINDLNIDTKYCIFIKRYCYIDFKKINKILLNIKNKRVFSLLGNLNITICESSTLTKFSSILDFENYISSLSDSEIIDLSKYCYMTNIGITGCPYHSATFVCLNDNDEYFDLWLNEFHAKSKIIYYKGNPYELKIGKNFFIKKYTHIGILPDKKVVYWNNKKKYWQLANKKISELLTNKG